MLKVVNIKFVDKGVLKAFFDVEVSEWHMTIYGCQLFEKEGRKWVSMPSRKVEADGDKAKYYPYLRFSEAVKKKFDDACLVELSKQSVNETQGNLNF